MNRTKKAISNAFWQLLEEKPYSKITVHDIVERCQVNRNTFYYHFQDIPALTEYTINEWADQMIQENWESGNPENIFASIAQECTKRKAAFGHLYYSSRREEFIRYLNKICLHVANSYITYMMTEADLTPEKKDFLIRYHKCMTSGVILDWFDANMSYDLGAFLAEIWEFLVKTRQLL